MLPLALKYNFAIALLLSFLTVNSIVYGQQNYYDQNNPQGPNYNPNNNPQINRVADSTEVQEDTTQKVKEKFDFWHSPHIATLASAILPGLGQAYNKKYWKVPIVWGIMGTLGYFFFINVEKYDDYRKAYFLFRNYEGAEGVPKLLDSKNPNNISDRQDAWNDLANKKNFLGEKSNQLSELKYFMGSKAAGDSIYIENNLAYVRDNARRTRDYMAVFGLLCYVLNMADAAVDAHFAKFDVSDNLSMKIEPSFISFSGQPQLGMTLRLSVVDNKHRKIPLTNN